MLNVLAEPWLCCVAATARQCFIATKGKGMLRLQAVKGFVQRLASKWRSAPPIDVVATAADLPVPAPADARGLFWKRRVYVVADQPTELIAKTLNHEVVAHHGLRALLGSKWHRFMEGLHRGLKATKDRPLRKLRDRVKRAYVDRRGRCALPPHLLSDEIAAAAVEDGTHAWTGAFKPRRARIKERFGKVLQLLRQRRGGKLKLGYQHLLAALEAAAQKLKTKCADAGKAVRRQPSPALLRSKRW